MLSSIGKLLHPTGERGPRDNGGLTDEPSPSGELPRGRPERGIPVTRGEKGEGRDKLSPKSC